MELKNKFLTVLVLLLSTTNGFSQDCNLVKLSDNSPTLSDSAALSKFYDYIFSDSSEKCHILLLRSAGEIPSLSISYLTETKGNLYFEFMKNDSILFKKNLMNRKLSVLSKDLERIKGYYMGECNTNKWSHVSERLLIVLDKGAEFTEIFSYNEDLRDILKSNSKTKSFVDLYDLILQLSKTK